MKTIYYSLLICIICTSVFAQNGLTVTNKGIVLQNLPSQNIVPSPQMGTVIYNNSTKSPNYFDGKNWVNMAGSLLSNAVTDSLTYSITTGNGFTSGNLPVQSLANGFVRSFQIGQPVVERATASEFTFSKLFDINSMPFIRAILSRRLFNIQFQFFKQNTTTPYSTIVLTDVVVTSIGNSVSNQNLLTENITLSPETIRYTNIANGHFVQINLATYMITSNLP
jgi:hypothetical protein